MAIKAIGAVEDAVEKNPYEVYEERKIEMDAITRAASSSVKEVSKTEDSQASSGSLQGLRQDEFVRSSKEAASAGIYSVTRDEAGKTKVLFEDPNSQEEREEVPEQDEAAPSNRSEGKKTTVNTDKVEAEIRKLKEEKQKLEQELQRAAGDEEKSAQLRNRLSSLEAEILSKDNDAYKKQHATYTNG